jgi:uncharacterized protein YdhG (YjbR/CyaY superfamily)
LVQFVKYNAAKGCIYFKQLADVDENILRQLLDVALKHNQALYGKQ